MSLCEKDLVEMGIKNKDDRDQLVTLIATLKSQSSSPGQLLLVVNVPRSSIAIPTAMSNNSPHPPGQGVKIVFIFLPL